MRTLFTAGLVLLFLGVALARRRDHYKRRREHRDGDDCRGVPDGGVVTWGCRAYTVCQNQRPVVIDCSALGLVYNPSRQRCDNKLSTPAPCGLYRDCRGKADGRYADLVTKCTAYYTCNGGQFFGHNQCNPGLVFNQEAQVCDWPYNVPAPCGTKGGATPKPEMNIRKEKEEKEERREKSRKSMKYRSKSRRMKMYRARKAKAMELRMRQVKEPAALKRRTGAKRASAATSSMFRETVHGMKFF